MANLTRNPFPLVLLTPTALGLFFAVAGCAGSQPRAQELPDGTLQLTCGSELSDCVRRAEEYCGDVAAEVLHGSTRDAGVGNGGATSEGTAGTIAEVQFVCGRGLRILPERLLPSKRRRGTQPPPTAAPAAPPPAAPAAPPPPASPVPARACVPGATQECVGLGACRGGQACMADGSGFAPCECAPAAATDTVK
ncbi:MAG: hypothetical protein JW751_09805 [Polyangiaceae bacterium]|nr:hypothetical protein [Polyangiaceae bacterium]